MDYYCRINEIKAYNNLSFVISGSTLEPDSYREETREATDEEREVWDILTLIPQKSPAFRQEDECDTES